MKFRNQYQTFFKTYLIVIALALIPIGVSNLIERNPWSMGDWVINYSGGFVRRGIIGQLALLLSRISHINIYGIVLLIQCACYAALLWCIWALVRDLSWSLWMILLIYSPATLSMILLNPGAAFRKELLLFTILSTTILLSERYKLTGIFGQVTVPVLVFIAVMSHEGQALYLPYLLGVYLVAVRKSWSSGVIAFIPAAMAGGVAFVLASTHPGNAMDASVICSSVGGGANPSSRICAGAIQYLSNDKNYARLDVIHAIHYWHLVYQAPYILLFSIIPVVMGIAALWNIMHRESRIFATCSCIAWIVSIPLFVYSDDWDRWISMHIFCSMLLLIMMERRKQLVEQIRTVSWSLPSRGAPRFAQVVFVAFMTLGWQCAFIHHFPLPLDKLQDYVTRRPSYLRQARRDHLG